MKKNFKATINCRICELAHCRAGAERIESVFPSFHARFFDACFILSYDAVDKSRFILVARQIDILKCQAWSFSLRQSTVWGPI
jgi:hypothetical protein